MQNQQLLNRDFLTRQDFLEVVDIAMHCDVRKLNIAINTAINIDLQEILCELWSFTIDTLEKDITNLTDFEKTLINGGYYQCGKNRKYFLGTKKIIVYYSYAIYVANSYSNDTGLGFVQKTSDYSLQVPKKEVDSFSIQHRNMGFSIINQYRDILCHNSSLVNVELKHCHSECGCGYGNCDDGIDTRRIINRPFIIRKE